MKRVVKDPVVRRKEIIEVAEKLFVEQGYAKTPVETIITKAGIAKGTFYHYFKSKHELLGAIVEQIGVDLQSYYTSVLSKQELSAVEKLKQMLRGPEKDAISSTALMDILHKKENREFQEQLNVQTINVIAPLIAQVVEQGNEEGAFSAKNPEETVQILLAGSQFLLDGGLFNWPPEKQNKLLKTFQVLFESAVGAKPGDLDFLSNVTIVKDNH